MSAVQLAIAKVHEAMEGRYDLTGEDLYYIHAKLCDLAEMTSRDCGNKPCVWNVSGTCKLMKIYPSQCDYRK